MIVYIFNIIDTFLTGNTLQALLDIYVQNPKIIALPIKQNNFTKEDFDILSNYLQKLPHLKCFDFIECELTYSNIIKLGDGLSYLTKLDRLNLSDDKINDVGINELCHYLPHMSNLKELYLGCIYLLFKIIILRLKGYQIYVIIY